MKDTWKNYFSFNKKQRNGIIVLVSFIALLLIYLFIADYFPASSNPVDFAPFKTDLEKAGIKASLANSNKSISSSSVDINSADTNALMALPKMTSYCARMIVRYRKKLGGYYTIKQLTEVWGMDTAIYKALSGKVFVNADSINKININTANVRQLAFHPYIKYYLAKAIINYRRQHGLFASLKALHKMVAIDDSTYSRIIPYLTVGKN